MLTLVNPEQRVPANHPIRLIKELAEVALKELSPYRTRGVYYTAFLGGLVNSTAAATELSSLFREVNERGAIDCCCDCRQRHCRRSWEKKQSQR
jgi:hypothetical protein